MVSASSAVAGSIAGGDPETAPGRRAPRPCHISASAGQRAIGIGIERPFEELLGVLGALIAEGAGAEIDQGGNRFRTVAERDGLGVEGQRLFGLTALHGKIAQFHETGRIHGAAFAGDLAADLERRLQQRLRHIVIPQLFEAFGGLIEKLVVLLRECGADGGIHVGRQGLGRVLRPHGGKRCHQNDGEKRRQTGTRPARRIAPDLGIQNREQAAFELRRARHGDRGPRRRAGGLHGARHFQQMAGVLGGAGAGSQHQVVGGAFPLLQKLTPGDPGQRVPPVQRSRPCAPAGGWRGRRAGRGRTRAAGPYAGALRSSRPHRRA